MPVYKKDSGGARNYRPASLTVPDKVVETLKHIEKMACQERISMTPRKGNPASPMLGSLQEF